MIITDNEEHWKLIKSCAASHGKMLERVTANGMVCMKCQYTVIDGVYRKL